MDRNPLIALAGGASVMALIVGATFTTMASASQQPCQRNSTKATTEQVVPSMNQSGPNEEA